MQGINTYSDEQWDQIYRNSGAFAVLPDEILVQIFEGSLGPNELAALSLTCRRFYHLTHGYEPLTQQYDAGFMAPVEPPDPHHYGADRDWRDDHEGIMLLGYCLAGLGSVLATLAVGWLMVVCRTELDLAISIRVFRESLPKRWPPRGAEWVHLVAGTLVLTIQWGWLPMGTFGLLAGLVGRRIISYMDSYDPQKVWSDIDFRYDPFRKVDDAIDDWERVNRLGLLSRHQPQVMASDDRAWAKVLVNAKALSTARAELQEARQYHPAWRLWKEKVIDLWFEWYRYEAGGGSFAEFSSSPERQQKMEELQRLEVYLWTQGMERGVRLEWDGQGAVEQVNWTKYGADGVVA